MQKDATGYVLTGIAGLDEILLGGLPRGNNVLVEGSPGSGKTTLGLAFMHAGAARFDEPGLIVSLELEPEKLIRDARGFHWNLDELIRQKRLRIVNASPAVLLREFRSGDSVLLQHLHELGARRLLIDGLTPLKLYAEAHHLPFREDLHALVACLTAEGVTTLMTSEREDGMTDVAHERYVFDTLISLARTEARRRVRRRITVEKSRGQDFIGGSHALELVAGEGVVVFRRAQARPKIDALQPVSTKRISTGIKPLDAMMGGGLYEGSNTLVTGISGTGKTVAGLQFLCESAKAGRRGLLVSLDEHVPQLTRNAQTLGLDLQKHVDNGLLFLHYESPLELDLDIHFRRVVHLIETHQIDCIVFDSVAVYEMTSAQESADFLYTLGTFCKDRLATAYFNYESPELLGISQISEDLKASPLVDNILLLSYVEISTQLRRALAVPKVRGTQNVQITREYKIQAGGITILEEGEVHTESTSMVPQLPFSSYYGLLSRSPSRKSPVIDEAIAHGAPLPGDTATRQSVPKK